MAATPTIVFVHGAWYSPWHWNKLRRRMTDVNTRVVALESTGNDAKSLSDMYTDADRVRSVVASASAPVVVVAHSYGGIPTTQALAGCANVAQIVYLAAFQLDVGSSLLGSIGGWAPDWWRFDEANGCMSIDEPTTAFFHDCPRKLASESAHQCRRQSIVSFQQTLTRASWREIPSTYVVTNHDAAIPREMQQEMAARSAVREAIDSSHSPFISRTEELAVMLRDILKRECSR